jgi:glycosyltransferase involved in cell wall biosynthesis
VDLTIVIPIGDWNQDANNVIEICQKSLSFEMQIILVLDDPKATEKEMNFNQISALKDIRVISYDGRNPGGARNEGLKNVRTKWVLFCDSDDKLVFEELKGLLSENESNEWDALIGGYVVQKGSEVIRLPRAFTSRTLNGISTILNPGIWRWVFRYEAIKNIEFPLSRIGEDQIFLCRFLDTNPNLIFKTARRIYIYIQSDEPRLTSQFNAESLYRTIEVGKAIRLSSRPSLNKILIIGMFWRMKTTLCLRVQIPWHVKIFRIIVFSYLAIISIFSQRNRIV